MGTRGAYGFRYHRYDKITYNHWDSYPEWLGENVVKFVRETPLKEMRRIFNRIALVNEDDMPTPEQIKECEPYTDLSVSRRSTGDWYCLLRGAQGDLFAYKNGLRYMIDNADFLRDSLFCEWAYVINLDEGVLEVYRGFQKTPDNNRYALDKPADDGYWHCKLAITFPLDNIPEDWVKQVYRACGMEECAEDG